jgi:hypothetical protein
LTFGKQLSQLGSAFTLFAMSATAAQANTLERAGASVNCSGYNLKAHAIDLSVGANYTIDYSFLVTVHGASTTIVGTINFTATASTVTVLGSGSWNLTANFTALTGSATLTSSGSTVSIDINGSTETNGSAMLNCAPGSWSQQGPKLVGRGAVSDPGFAVEQGASISLSGDGTTAVVGGMGDSNGVGAAWVFTGSGRVWRQQGPKLVGAGAVGPAGQGYSVSLSANGNTAVLGGPFDNMSSNGLSFGAAWVFTRSAGIWSQQAKLVGTGAVSLPAQGWSVSLSADGNTAIVGGPNDGNNGAAWVFTRSGGTWSQQGSKLVGTGAVGDAFQGASVSLSADGNTAIVGGPKDNLSSNGSAGAVWVFTRSAGVWSQQGPKLVGIGAVGDAFQGASVSLSGDGTTAIVGGPGDNNIGAAWVFTRSAVVWSQQGPKLVRKKVIGPAGQGRSVSVSGDGNTALVGGFGNDDGLGTAWVYTRSAGAWRQQGPDLVGTGTVGPAALGYSVSLSADGNTAVVGGPGDDNVGAAWVFAEAAPTGFGTPGEPHCYANSAAALVRRFHGLAVAAAALGYASIPAMQHAILRFCRE